MKRSVVISGVGSVCALGVGRSSLWNGLSEGSTPIGPVTAFDASAYPCALAAEVKDFSAKDYLPKSYRKAVKVMARDIELAVAAAKEAVEDAGLITRAAGDGQAQPPAPTYPSSRLGCQIGAGLIASEADELAVAYAAAADGEGTVSTASWGRAGMANLQPLWMLKYLPNMLACHVTIIHGAEGPSNTLTNAQASGLLCAGESSRVIERGDAEACLSGAAESKINLTGFMRLTLQGWLSPRGPQDTEPRPFDPSSAGAIPGEGGAILILEEKSAALARGIKPYAQVLGFGAAQGIGTGEHAGLGPDARALELAIRRALKDASLTPEAIDAIVPLGCGVPAWDAAEAQALRTVLGARASKIPLLTLSPVVGHTSAGHGALALAAAAMSLRTRRLPAGALRDLQGQKIRAAEGALKTILVCSPAVGGQNAAVVLGAVPDFSR